MRQARRCTSSVRTSALLAKTQAISEGMRKQMQHVVAVVGGEHRALVAHAHDVSRRVLLALITFIATP